MAGFALTQEDSQKRNSFLWRLVSLGPLQAFPALLGFQR